VKPEIQIWNSEKGNKTKSYHNREGNRILEIEVLHMAVIKRSTAALIGDFDFLDVLLMTEMSFTGEGFGFAVRLRSC
jgi:hypothetical protein